MTDNLDEFEELMLGEQRRNYSAKTIDHAMNPRNLGVMENADVYATITGPCGDTMEIWLKIDGSTILRSSFMTDGCASALLRAAWSLNWQPARYQRSHGDQSAGCTERS